MTHTTAHTEGQKKACDGWAVSYDLEVRAISLALVTWDTLDILEATFGYGILDFQLWAISNSFCSVAISSLELIMIPIPIYLERRDKKLGIHQVEKADINVNAAGVDDISSDIDNTLTAQDSEKRGGVFVVMDDGVPKSKKALRAMAINKEVIELLNKPWLEETPYHTSGTLRWMSS
ncbi:hypothetical protein V1520DRAFT_329894 [Lipomyces starkeyi]